MEDTAESGLLSFCFSPLQIYSFCFFLFFFFFSFFAISFVHFFFKCLFLFSLFLFVYCGFLKNNSIIRNSSREIGFAFPDKVALLNSAWFDPYIHYRIYANSSFLPSQEFPPPQNNMHFIIGIRFAFPDRIVLPDTARLILTITMEFM